MTRPFSPERRSLLKSLVAAGATAAAPIRVFGQRDSDGSSEAVVRYLESLARPDGGYAWGDQEISHLTPTFGVIGSYHLLGRDIPRKAALTDFVRTHHPRELKKLEQERRIFDWQQLQALAWLQADLREFRSKIAALTTPLGYLRQYERNGYPVFQSELGAVMSHALLGLPTEGIAEAFGAYIETRRRPNGSFNNTPAADDGDGHVMNTFWALQALGVLRRPLANREALIVWLQSCQRPNGGFTFAPSPEFGGVEDVAYTRAAVRALAVLGSGPTRREACIAWIQRLVNSDGGFADRPEWLSNPSATYFALDALAALDALSVLRNAGGTPFRRGDPFPSNLKVFSIQIEAHGQGSPADTVELARALKIDLWGAKNAKPAWLARVREIAAERKVPVQFFPANEEYGTWVNVPGLGTYSHTSDVIFPGNADAGASLANQGVVTWPEYREKRLASLMRGGGRLVWQFGENEELVRMFLDDSVERGGFAAISTFHFGNPDFMNTEPFLNRWRGRIPFIALQDAHGPEPWWFADQTTGFRTLFLATEPTWDGWLNALKQNWVVAVRRDVWTKGKTWMHSGSNEVRDYVQAREASWRWWDNPEIERPMVSIVALMPKDELEPGKPERGFVLRVRCAWENTPQGLLKAPRAELVSLTLDGERIAPELVSRQRPNGLREEHAHFHAVPNPTPGRHVATVVVRVLETKCEVSRTLEFNL